MAVVAAGAIGTAGYRYFNAPFDSREYAATNVRNSIDFLMAHCTAATKPPWLERTCAYHRQLAASAIQILGDDWADCAELESAKHGWRLISCCELLLTDEYEMTCRAITELAE